MYTIKDEISRLEAMASRLSTTFPRHIHHIRFPRYKNMEENARIDFTFPITALVGANGSGKTSVLNALYGAPDKHSTGEFWFSTEVDPIEEGDGSPNRFIYGHFNASVRNVVETRKARVRKKRDGRSDPNYWEPTKESPGDGMAPYPGAAVAGRSLDRWNPVRRKVIYINFRRELSAFDKYFYFGKDPPPTPKELRARRRVQSKKDQIRIDSVHLSKIITANDCSVELRGKKVALENRLLGAAELKAISFILGRSYSEARWVRHRLFKVDGGVSVIFRTALGRYSEAFAGSGEVAVASCVVQVLAAKENSLILLDEPEVSLHPGAQERLLAFLAHEAKRSKLQIIFSTHSPHLIQGLPENAIKVFVQGGNGAFSVINSSHPYSAFIRLGAAAPGKISVLVEDSLAKSVVEQALALFPNAADRDLFKVEIAPGGAQGIVAYRIPVLLDSEQHLVLLDGDMRLVDEFLDPETLAADRNPELEGLIRQAVGTKPHLPLNGAGGVADVQHKSHMQRRYLSWIRSNLAYLPRRCPEELALVAAGVEGSEDLESSQQAKDLLAKKASEIYGRDCSSAEIDMCGAMLLGSNRDVIPELLELSEFLKSRLDRLTE